MKRRELLASAGAAAALAALLPFRCVLAVDTKSQTIADAYSLWYNRPAFAELDDGFCVGYITSGGEIRIARLSQSMADFSSIGLYKFEYGSDHGSPSVLRIASGPYAGRILVCFSNHSTPLLAARSKFADSIDQWDEVRTIDKGRSTYASLSALPNGRIVLMHTLQERAGSTDATEWRKVVIRTSEDGGDTWGEPSTIAGIGPGTFPYSTALAVSPKGKLALAYAVYRSKEKRHDGLCVSFSKDAFSTKREITVDLGEGATADNVPYETKWLTESLLAVCYSRMGGAPGLATSRLVIVDTEKEKVLSDKPIAEVSVHTYAGGAALSDDGRNAVYSPADGGLVRKDLRKGTVTPIISTGSYSSPSLLTMHGRKYLVALRDPEIKTTLKFRADLFITRLT